MPETVKKRRIQRRITQNLSQIVSVKSLVLQRVYSGRGIIDISELDYRLSKLSPPGKLHGATLAAELLADTIETNGLILIIGDFDADGATSTALAISVLRKMGVDNVDYLVPNRFEFGYGLTPEIVAVAIKKNPSLIVTVDNGISSIDGVAAAKAAGISVLITDHHFCLLYTSDAADE